MGHCSSYNEIEAVDNSLAMELLAKAESNGVIIPSNILPGGIIQAAPDNNDINEEILNGKRTTHAITIVLFQRRQFGPLPKPAALVRHAIKKRALDLAGTSALLPILDCSGYGKRPAVLSFLNKMNGSWLECPGRLTFKA